MNKRLTQQQKVHALLVIMSNAIVPLSAYALARQIGFRTGRPLYDALCWLNHEGAVDITRDGLMGKDFHLFWLNEKGRSLAKNEHGINVP